MSEDAGRVGPTEEGGTNKDKSDDKCEVSTTVADNDSNINPQTTKENGDKPNWVEKGTLIVLLLTLCAAIFAGYEAMRLADLTGIVINDARNVTADQARDTRNSLTIAKAAADAAAKSADVAEKTLRRDRAFVYLKNTQNVPVVNTEKAIVSWAFIYHLENGGNTPTKDMQIKFAIIDFPGEMPADFSFPYNISENPRMLAPPHQDVQTTPLFEPIDTMVKVWQKTVRIYIYGEISYKDVFDDKSIHVTRFCRELADIDADPRSVPSHFFLSVYPRYNCADDECK